MLSRQRIAVIHVARRQLKLSEQDYRAVLARVAAVASATQLDELGFLQLMAEFERLGFRSTWKRKTGGNRPGMASPSQIGLMEALWREWRGEEDAAGFRHWLERFHKVSDPRFATRKAANAIITALKAMTARRQATG